MIFQAGNLHESASLFNVKGKKLVRRAVGYEPKTQKTQYTTLTTKPLRICYVVNGS